MQAKRQIYIDRLISHKNNGMIKIITGLRRSGKSYLLFTLFVQQLKDLGVDSAHIIKLALDDDKNIMYRNPLKLSEYIRSKITQNGQYYILLDEIQEVVQIPNPYFEGIKTDDVPKISFVDVLNGLLKIDNVDVYVTGSNSKFLSTDILTEFRGRGDEIKIHPLSFSEFMDCHKLTKEGAWKEYVKFGGMPALIEMTSDEDKTQYLKHLVEVVYMNDIVERNHIKAPAELKEIVNLLFSSIGSITNPTRIMNTLRSVRKSKINDKTISDYLSYLENSFFFEKALRFDVKGKRYFSSNNKYYVEDIGLRNAGMNYRQMEESHIMENIVFNELKIRGFQVDVGVVETTQTIDGTRKQLSLEIDFIVTKGNEKLYIQSALEMPTVEKQAQEIRPLLKTHDAFRKIVIEKNDVPRWTDDNGIIHLSLFDFLLDKKNLETTM